MAANSICPRLFAVTVGLCALAVARADVHSNPMQARKACVSDRRNDTLTKLKACCDALIAVSPKEKQTRFVDECLVGTPLPGKAKPADTDTQKRARPAEGDDDLE